MAFERMSAYMKDSVLRRVTQLNHESSQMLRIGQTEEALKAMDEARKLAVALQVVSNAESVYLNTLQQAGIEQPPANFFSPREKPTSEQSSQPLSGEKVRRVELPSTSSQEGRRQRHDLSIRQERIAFAVFAINEDHTDFAFKTDQEIAREAYKDLHDDVAPEDIPQVVKTRLPHMQQAINQIDTKLRSVDPEQPTNVPLGLASLINWLSSQKEFANLTPSELTLVLRREMSFKELSTLATSRAELAQNPQTDPRE